MNYNVGGLQNYFWFQISAGSAVVNNPFAAVGAGSVPNGGGGEWLLAKSFTNAFNFWATTPYLYVGDPVLDYWNGETQAAWANGSGTYYTATLIPPLDLRTQLFAADPAGPDAGFPGAYGTVTPTTIMSLSPERGDDRRVLWLKILQSLQTRAGALPANNPGRNDDLRWILVKVLRSLLGLSSGG